MDWKKKIGLVTWIGGPNYGTVLQAYALYRTLQEMGNDVTVIRKYQFIWGIKKSLNHVLEPLGINILKNRDPKNEKFRKIRTLQEETFTYCRVVGPFGKRKAGRRFDAYVCGSDQMWNSYNCFDPFFFLDFAAGKPKISYAVSIGTKDIKAEYRSAIADLIEPFKAVSVREANAAVVLTELTGRQDIKTVLDPVFLISPEGWREFAAKGETPAGLPSRYVLCYVLGRINNPEQKILETAKANDAEIVIIPSGEYPEFNIPGAFVCKDAGAREFVGLVAGACAMVTDSFHGTAFSIMMNVPVVSLKRFADDDPASQNSRIDNILNLKDRIPELREFSFKFLSEALG